jgi:integrase
MKKQIPKRVQLTGVHGKRVNMIFPPSVTKTEAEVFKTCARRMVQCQLGNLALQRQDIEYVRKGGDAVKRKFRLLGIRFEGDEESGAECSLSSFLSSYTASKRGETERKLIETARRLERFFGPQRDMRDITKTDAVNFRNWLLEHEKLAESSTARRVIGYASQIMAAAIEDGLIVRNPFKGKELPKTVRTNRERHYHITPEQTKKLWDAIQTDEDRIRFVLLRYLGLRAPSELDALTWKDVDWDSGFVTIRAKKTKHHKDQGYRKCPFRHPDVEPVLRAAYEMRESDDSPIVPRITAPVLRKRVIKWIGRAGLDVWPQLLVNFRRSAVTDAHDLLPPHVVSAYFGHSEAISEANYTMRTAAHADAFAAAKSLINDEEAA